MANSLSSNHRSAVRRIMLVPAFLAALVAVVAAGVNAADEKPQQGNAAEKRARRPAAKSALDSVPTSAAQAAHVLEFASTHHPELAKLLEHLKKAESPEFPRAIRELAAQVERIDRIRERSPARFEVELRNWKVDSQIKLLVARWAMSRDPDLERQIRELLRERNSKRTEQLHAERERLRQRLQQVDKQLGELTSDPEEYLNQEFVRLTRKVAAAKRQPAAASSTVKKSATAAEKKKNKVRQNDGVIPPR
jgi:hypothetical protein